MSDSTSGGTFIELTASIVSAYVSNNSVPSAELSALIGQVHTALTRVSSGHGEVLGEGLKPAQAPMPDGSPRRQPRTSVPAGDDVWV